LWLTVRNYHVTTLLLSPEHTQELERTYFLGIVLLPFT
jgi:hypothetical protein